VVNFDNKVIERVLAAKTVTWFIGRPTEWLVIAAVPRLFGPGIGGPNSAER
jgi:hypothetical protein